MIDLHTHTTESDGTYSPEQLIAAAAALPLTAIAITDHDTFAGYRKARPFAEAANLQLICGIELSTKLEAPKRRTVHLLGYFLRQAPGEAFLSWLTGMQESRRDRNRRLSLRLQTMGLDVTLDEVENLGRSMAGRPHFARLMVQKGYVSTPREAFDRYLDESAPGYVERDEPTVQAAIALVQDNGGVASLAHPIRLGVRDLDEEEAVVANLASAGLGAIEAFHSDQLPEDTHRYLSYAAKYQLKVTGGSDFHGENKPSVRLGVGPGMLNVPESLLDALRQ